MNNKASINEKNEYGWTPLHFAADKGHLRVVEYLVNQKADINAKNLKEKTPLRQAYDSCKMNIVQYLKRHGGK